MADAIDDLRARYSAYGMESHIAEIEAEEGPKTKECSNANQN